MKKGFTLIELLIVVAIIAILAVVVFVALDPLTRFRDARDSTRWSDSTALLDAAKLDQVDNGGAYVAAISGLTAGTNYEIGTCAALSNPTCTDAVVFTGCADLGALVTEKYIANLPLDPQTGTTVETGYYIQRTSNDALIVGACEAEGINDDLSEVLINVSR